MFDLSYTEKKFIIAVLRLYKIPAFCDNYILVVGLFLYRFFDLGLDKSGEDSVGTQKQSHIFNRYALALFGRSQKHCGLHGIIRYLASP